MADRYPKAASDPFNDGGSFIGAAPRGLLHTTEGTTYAGARSVYASRQVAPHFTVSFQNGIFQVWQHVPITRAARALRNPAGGVQTNRANCIQIEIVGRAVDAPNFPRAYLVGIRELMRWIEANAGVPRKSTVTWKPYPQSYGTNAVQRLPGWAWNAYSGWLGHMHCPENSHGDPGLIDIAYLLSAEEDVVAKLRLFRVRNDPMGASRVYIALAGLAYWFRSSQEITDATGVSDQDWRAMVTDVDTTHAWAKLPRYIR